MVDIDPPRPGLADRGLSEFASVTARLLPLGYVPHMAYDKELATRIRTIMGDQPNVTEKTMFGGLAFLIGGNMAVAASGQGGVLVRVDPDESDELVASTPATLMEMRGRSMRGWLRVAPEDVETDAALGEWVGRGTAYARSLPAKER
jgi:hypothetical protein